MKISYNWLKEFIDIDKTPEQLADDLSLFGHEVEGIEKIGEDSVLDFEITPNRGDCLSILGMAREISALYNIQIKQEKTFILRSMEESAQNNKKLEIKIEKPEICPRFTARIIDNIKITDSPKWLQEKLATFGFRPINNIVDITNYVMIATGQPLHAFDYDKIKDGQMNVRLSKKDEEVITLDGKSHILSDNAVIIEDSEKIYDLAGIMGGYKSEVDENTKTIVLQGAIFDPVLIRRASKKLHHQTDASYRYERGVDYEGTILGVDMAAKIIQELCDAKVGELIDKKTTRQEDKEIDVDLEKVNKLIGIDIDNEKAKGYLERLGFGVSVVGSRLAVSVPSYRAYDVKIWQDIAEEIARIHGYNNINKIQMSPLGMHNKAQINEGWQKKEIIKDICKEAGFTETYSYSFADKDKIELLGFNINDCVETTNPISTELKYLRPSLLLSLLAQIAKNPWDPQVNIFEIEKVFNKKEEWYQLGVAVVGKQEEYLKKVMDILKIKAEINNIDQKILDIYKIRRPVKYVIIDIADIDVDINKPISYEISRNQYQPISKYPPTVRDLSFFVDKNEKEDEILKTIKDNNKNILIVELFDVYEKENQKSLAYHIWIQDADADEIIDKIIKELEIKYQAKLRR